MAISLGTLVVELLANTGHYMSGMSKSAYEGKKTAREIHESFTEMGSKIGSASQAALSSLGQFGTIAGEVSRGLVEAFEGIGKSTSGIGLALTAVGGLGVAAIGAAAGLVELGKG